jgi:hypothetical protein
MKKKQNTGFIKNINPIWRNLAIGFTLMAAVSYYLAEKKCEKDKLIDPIQTEAIFIDTYCNKQAYGKSQVDYLGVKYQYFVSTTDFNKPSKYFATHVIYVGSRQECEVKAQTAKSAMQKIPIWYERTDPTQASFSLEKCNAIKGTSFFLVIAFVLLLIGGFWAWGMQEK